MLFQNPKKVFGDLESNKGDNIFEIRHIIAHEAEPKVELDFDKISGFILSVESFV